MSIRPPSRGPKVLPALLACLAALLVPSAPANAQPDVLVHPGMEIHQDSVLCTLGYVDPQTRIAFTAGHCRASGTVTDKGGTVIGTQVSFRDNTPDGTTIDTNVVWLRYGSTGALVKTLQQRLGITQDGSFGPVGRAHR